MSQDPTKVYLPPSAQFPVEITALLQAVGSPIKKHTPLLRYKYRWKPQKNGDENNISSNESDADPVFTTINAFENDNENAVAEDDIAGTPPSMSHSARHSSTGVGGSKSGRRRSSLDVQIATQHEAYSTFESALVGEVSEWLVKPGDIIRSAQTPILYILEPCSHPIQFGGMCAVCGKSLGEDRDYADFTEDEESNRIQMSHENNGLTVSYAEAERIEMSLEKHLQQQKKLILVVDLDQTVIQATVDPTVGEWMKDRHNPNNSALEDVEKFCLMETIYKPPPNDRTGPAIPVKEICWYYVKMRPGLSYFLKEMNKYYEMHIYTMATKAYASAIAKIIDPTGVYFGDRILSRDDSGSLVHKNLQRLFPVSTSMVAIIDDRGDVWNWCDNLIKVSPFNFFVGIGDINSSFLPQQTDVMKASVDEIMEDGDKGEKGDKGDKGEDQEDQGDQLDQKDQLDQLDQKGQHEEEEDKEKGGNADTLTKETQAEPSKADVDMEGVSNGDPDSTKSTEDHINGNSINSTDAGDVDKENGTSQASEEPIETEQSLVEPEASTEDNVTYVSDTDLSPQALEDETLLNKRSATLEAQQVERPLQKLQNKIHEKKLLNDNDRELLRVENILKHIHTSYYEEFSKGDVSPNLETIIPHIKSSILDGCVILFSGVIPLSTKTQEADIVRWTRSFGAVVVFDYVDTITHLVAMSKGTAKVCQTVSRKGVDNVHIVKLGWLMSSLASWERLPEKDFEFKFTPQEIENLKKSEPLSMEVNDESGDEIDHDIEGTEDFVQSLKQGDMNWEDIDKELEEFMADEDSGDDDNSDDEEANNDKHGGEDEPSNKRKGWYDEDESAAAKRSKVQPETTNNDDNEEDDSDDDDDSSIDHDFLRELENDLM